jgi:hypothetical protein
LISPCARVWHQHRSHEQLGVSTTAARHPFIASHVNPPSRFVTFVVPRGQTHR